MGLLAVVLFTPDIQGTPNLVHRSEPTSIQALIAEPAVEA